MTIDAAASPGVNPAAVDPGLDLHLATPPQMPGPDPQMGFLRQHTPPRVHANFDPAFFVIAVNDSVFFGSSVDDAVHCLDARTGQEKWVFNTDGQCGFRVVA